MTRSVSKRTMLEKLGAVPVVADGPDHGSRGVYNVVDDDPAPVAEWLRGASNAKAKRELAWQPGHPSWRTGFAA